MAVFPSIKLTIQVYNHSNFLWLLDESEATG